MSTNRPHQMMDTVEISCSYPTDFVSPINGKSPFVSSLCDVLDEFGENRTINELAKELNTKLRNGAKVTKTIDDVEYEFLLMSKFEGCLTKELRFSSVENETLSQMKSYPVTLKRDCLIIPIEFYGGHKNRSNASYDSLELRVAFERLGFKCHVMSTRVTVEDARHEIRKLSTMQEGKDMFAICILAHGGPNKYIQFSCGKMIQLQYLISVSTFRSLIKFKSYLRISCSVPNFWGSQRL